MILSLKALTSIVQAVVRLQNTIYTIAFVPTSRPNFVFGIFFYDSKLLSYESVKFQPMEGSCARGAICPTRV